jgi:hypothetical protein
MIALGLSSICQHCKHHITLSFVCHINCLYMNFLRVMAQILDIVLCPISKNHKFVRACCASNLRLNNERGEPTQASPLERPSFSLLIQGLRLAPGFGIIL